MSSYGSWSVKGIDDRARAVAKEKARLEGVTLGDYINNLLLEGHSEAGPRDLPQRERYEPPRAQADPDISPSLDSLMRRIEATEARSTLAITGIDQSVLGLLARLENSEHTTATVAADVEAMVDGVRETHQALQAKLAEMEADNRADENLQAMKALEHALGKLADHVYEENGLSQDETSAIKGRMEAGFFDLSERVEGMEVKIETTLSDAASRVEKAVQESELRAEGTTRHLSERFSNIESSVATKLAKVDDVDNRMKSVEGDVSGAIKSMESTLVRVQERLNRAETTTDVALKALEQTFANLDQRIDTVAEHANPEHVEALRQQYEAKFDGLANELRLSIDETRLQLANEIEQAAVGENPELMGRMESAIGTLQEQLLNGEERSNRAIEQVSEQVTEMANQFDKSVHESERRSAAAIEQVGDQVATAITRIQARQEDTASKLSRSLAETGEANEARLSAAISNISERLDGMQSQTISVMSPVQKAILSLAARLESLEDFTAPPHSEKPENDLPFIPDVEAHAPEPIEQQVETEIAEEPPKPEHIEDDAFVAGLPEVEDTSNNDIFAEPEITEWPADEEAADADYVSELKIDEDNEPETFLADAFNMDAPKAEEETDPLTAFESENDAWDDGRDEARDSDIFANDLMSDFDGLTEEATDFSSSVEPDTAEIDFPDLEDVSLADPDDELEVDEDATNYLARARRAAIYAAEGSSTPSKRPQSTATVHTAKRNRGSRVPAIAAVSALAVVTAGASAAYITLRGTQDDTLNSVAVASIADTKPPRATAEAPEPSLGDVSYSEDDSPIDDVLFDAVELEQGSMTPADEAPLATPEPILSTPILAAPAPVVLPQIAPLKSLESAAQAGDPVAELTLGESLLAADNFTDGPTYVRRAAEKGLPAAQYRLAKLHEKGLGVPRDLVQARTWTEKAAKGGNVKAMHDLAVFYADGDGGPQSYAGAVEWFRKAADYGIVDSQYNLAVLYENGLGISPSNSAALYWYEVAARNGDPSASENVTALRRNMSLEDAQSAQQRAANWTATKLNAAANGTFTSTSWENGSRDQIVTVQTVLNGLGYEAGTPDGLVGPGTRTAIRSFQANSGLPTSGTVNAALIEALNAETSSTS